MEKKNQHTNYETTFLFTLIYITTNMLIELCLYIYFSQLNPQLQLLLAQVSYQIAQLWHNFHVLCYQPLCRILWVSVFISQFSFQSVTNIFHIFLLLFYLFNHVYDWTTTAIVVAERVEWYYTRCNEYIYRAHMPSGIIFFLTFSNILLWHWYGAISQHFYMLDYIHIHQNPNKRQNSFFYLMAHGWSNIPMWNAFQTHKLHIIQFDVINSKSAFK